MYSKSNGNPCFKRKHSHDRNQKIDNPPTEINKSSHIQCKTMSLTHFQRESWRKAESPCPIMLSENSVKDDSWFYTQYTHKYCSILMCSWSYRVVCSWLRDVALKKKKPKSSGITMMNQTLWPINGSHSSHLILLVPNGLNKEKLLDISVTGTQPHSH